jgi:glycerol-3-phosphate dehydrogenase (NAD(P)+)
MTQKDFWLNAPIGVIGGGSWGTVLAILLSRKARHVRLKVRDPEVAKSMNSKRVHPKVFSELALPEALVACSDWEAFFEERPLFYVWVVPSSSTREAARDLSPYMQGDEILLHATKGIEGGTLKRISVMLEEELPIRRIGVLSGPNLAHEIAHAQPAGTVIASRFEEVREAGFSLFDQPNFRVTLGTDVIGVEWAGALKNILAIASGAFDALKLGWSARAMLLTEGLAEIVRFGVELGGKQETFLGLAGMGDVLATCSSSLSRNYRVGHLLAEGIPLDSVIRQVGFTAEGVQTTQHVAEFAKKRKIYMPITEGVRALIAGEVKPTDLLRYVQS